MTQPYNPFQPSSNPFSIAGGSTPPAPSTVYTGNSSSIYQQIEGTANYYQPNVYELLSFYGALQTQSDELDGQFLPITDVKPTTSQQTLVFAVGVLAPSSSVVPNATLDRSGTLAQTAPLNTANLDPTTGQERVTAAPIPPSAGPTASNSTDPYVQLVVTANKLGQQPEQLAQVLYSESGFQSSAQNLNSQGVPVAVGISQIQGYNGPGGGFAGSTAAGLGLTEQQYLNFNQLSTAQQMPYVQKYFQQCSGLTQGMTAAQLYSLNLRPSGLNPDGTIFNSSISGQAKYVSGNPSATTMVNGVAVITPESLAARLPQTLPSNIQSGINAARDSLGMTNPSGVLTPTAAPATQYQTVGSPNASAALAAVSTYQNSNLNTSGLGQQFQAAQQYMISSTQAAIQRMQNTPPLKMLVNPSSFRLSAEKIVSDSEWSRNGPIVEHWGEQLDKIEASGKVAAFFSVDASQATSSIPGVGAGPGMTRVARQYSSSYQNFLSLWLLYKNNGGIWLADFINSSSTQTSNLSVLGSIYIYYDNILYIGSFDSFNLTETETAPFTLEYNFSFTVRSTFLLDNTDDLSLSLASLSESQNNGVTNSPPILSVTTPTPNQQPAGLVVPVPGLTPQQQSALQAASTSTPALLGQVINPGSV